MDKDKEKVLSQVVKDINKEYGEGSVMILGTDEIVDVSCIPTGSISLDNAIGIGGIPRGRAIEIYGQEASGKTTLALHIVAESQKLGGSVAFIDVEHALDPKYAKTIGVKTNELLISQPDAGEEALEIAEKFVRSSAIDLVVIDSVAALVTRAEIEGEMGDSHIALRARLMSQALRKLTSVMSKTSTSVIFINQVRFKIGISFGNPYTTPGGMALKFHSSLRMEIRRISSLKQKDENIGLRAKVKIVKNKVATPFKEAEFDIMYGQGISREGELLDLGEQEGIVVKTGAWYYYGKESLGQGRENSKEFLKENPKIAIEIEEKIRKNLGLSKVKDKEKKENKDEK